MTLPVVSTVHTSHNISTIHTAQSICVYNDVAFVIHWHLHDVDHDTNSMETNSYPVWQIKCMSALKAGNNVIAGTSLLPTIKAVWGNSVTPTENVFYDEINATQITYVCHGTTLNYNCIQETPPPTAADVTKDVDEFILGFRQGLGMKIGFTKCITDINSTYNDVISVVDFFE